MNAYEKSLQLNLVGTPTEIVGQLKATGITQNPIRLSELLYLMNFRGMLTKLVSNQNDEKWAGTVLAMKAALVSLALNDLVANLDRWLSHITNPRNVNFDTTDHAVAAPFWAMRVSFGGQEGMPSLADFDAVANLGGGWLYADLDDATFIDQKNKYLLQQILISKREQFDSAYNIVLTGINNGSVSTEEEIISGLQVS
jgi:hypothetical protein